jgi:hypothetical protein
MLLPLMRAPHPHYDGVGGSSPVSDESKSFYLHPNSLGTGSKPKPRDCRWMKSVERKPSIKEGAGNYFVLLSLGAGCSRSGFGSGI